MDMDRGRRALVVLAAALPLLSSVLLSPVEPATAAGRTTTTYDLATGLTLTEISDPSGPYEIRVLTIDPSTALTIDTVMPNKTYPGVLQPSIMGSRENALAAINGDFTTAPGRPVHPFAMDGYVKQTGFQFGTSFGIRSDETAAYVGTPALTVRIHDNNTGSFQLSAFDNGKPERGQIAGFSASGGTVEAPPKYACAVRLKASGKLTWTAGEVGLSKDYKVDAMKCQAKPMARKGGIVLATPRSSSATAATIKAMKLGDVVTVTWSMGGMPGIVDSVGSSPILVDGGRNVGPCCGKSYFFGLNPRTGIGVAPDGTLFFVVVDGRDPSWSVGMKLDEFAQVFIDLGATYAINLDGGGSTAMWVKGMGLVNHPSDSTGERPVSNAVLVLPGADSDGATPLPAPPVAGPSISWSRVWSQMATDPGSIGGLADAMAHGDLGWTGPLPTGLVAAARVFRGLSR